MNDNQEQDKPERTNFGMEIDFDDPNIDNLVPTSLFMQAALDMSANTVPTFYWHMCSCGNIHAMLHRGNRLLCVATFTEADVSAMLMAFAQKESNH